MDMDIFHCCVYFSGKVQGVGFRYQCMKVALEYEVCGYAENLADGRVLLEIEGKESEVEKFIVAIKDQMEIFIKEMEMKTLRRPAKFSKFIIK